MGLKTFFIDFDALNYVRVRIVTERGRVIEFTVQYETIIDGEVYPVVRYDTAHGDAHRDLLDAAGRTVEKLWLAGWDFDAALQHGLRDIKANWPQYRTDFIQRTKQ
jgi:hypothetical protein